MLFHFYHKTTCIFGDVLSKVLYNYLFEIHNNISVYSNIISDTMPTLPLPVFPRALEREIKAATFTFSRPLNNTEKKFAQEGFRKNLDGSIECVSCGVKTKVNLSEFLFSIHNLDVFLNCIVNDKFRYDSVLSSKISSFVHGSETQILMVVYD